MVWKHCSSIFNSKTIKLQSKESSKTDRKQGLKLMSTSAQNDALAMQTRIINPCQNMKGTAWNNICLERCKNRSRVNTVHLFTNGLPSKLEKLSYHKSYIFSIIRRPHWIVALEYPCNSHISYLISHSHILTISYSDILYLIFGGREFEGGTVVPTTKFG